MNAANLIYEKSKPVNATALRAVAIKSRDVTAFVMATVGEAPLILLRQNTTSSTIPAAVHKIGNTIKFPLVQISDYRCWMLDAGY